MNTIPKRFRNDFDFDFEFEFDYNNDNRFAENDAFIMLHWF